MAASSPISADMLQALLSVDATERKAAEEQLQATSITDRVTAFVQALISPNNGGALLHMVAVLLRRDILKLTVVNDATLLQSLASPLLQAFQTVHATTQTAVGNCLAEVCSVLEVTDPASTTGGGGGGGLSTIVISQILGAIAASASQGDLASLQLLVALAERAPQSFAEMALPSLPQLIETLVKHPVFQTRNVEEMDPSWPNKGRLFAVAVELVTTTAVATVGGSSNNQEFAADNNVTTNKPNPQSPASQLGTTCLLPLLTLDDIFSDRETVSKVLPLWMQAAQVAPDLFVGSDPRVWERTVLLCLQVSGQDEDAKLAIQAMHVLNLLVLHQKSQRQSLTQSVIPRIMNILLHEVDYDVEAWAMEPVTSSVVDKDTFGDDDGEAGYAYEQLEAWIRTSPAMAMAIVLPLLERHMGGDWSHQWAATVCIQACAEVAPVAFTPHTPTALQAALQLASSSSNPRVQYQAIQLITILCETGNSVVWEHFAERILQTLAQAVSSPFDRIKAMACTALVAYCRPEEKEKMDGERFVAPYLTGLLQALVKGPMTSGSTVVQSRAVQAVICLAHVAGPSFVHYYSSVMPVLLTLAQQAKSNEYEDVKLQAMAIEAATVLGQSLGDENRHLFAEDATRIMQWIVPVLHQGQDESSNVPMGQLLSACARIASVAGEAYAEYAKTVVPLLIQRVQAATDVEITEGDETKGIQVDEETGEESVTVAVPGRGLTKLTINTTKIQEKVEAIRGLYEHAISLEGLFAPYVQSSYDALFPLLKFRYAADVRATTAQSLSAVYEAACCHGEETGDFSLCNVQLPKLVTGLAQQIKDENEMEALFAEADALSEIMFSSYSRRLEHGPAMLQHFSIGDAKTLVDLCLKSALVPCLERRSKITQILSKPEDLSGEDEKESYKQSLAEEERLLTPLVDSTGYTLKLFGEPFYPVFCSSVAPVLGPFLGGGLDIRARWSAVCLYDDCVEFCGAKAAEEAGTALVEGILLGLNDATNGGDNDLKQAAVYGVIQLARYAPPGLLVPHAQPIFTSIYAIANGTKEDAPTPALFENCVAAVATLFLFGQAPFRSSTLLPASVSVPLLLKHLPLTEDFDEAKHCHAGFVDLVVGGQVVDIDVHCGSILRIAGAILALVQEEDDVATPETCQKLAAILRDLEKNSPKSAVSATFEALDEGSKSAIQSAVQAVSP